MNFSIIECKNFMRISNQIPFVLFIDVSRDYPPCMRIIVQETNIPKLKIGTLFLVTCTGGSIGREGDHPVLIRDINISKVSPQPYQSIKNSLKFLITYQTLASRKTAIQRRQTSLRNHRPWLSKWYVSQRKENFCGKARIRSDGDHPRSDDPIRQHETVVSHP